MFQAGSPVTSRAFHDRADALARVARVFESLERGQPRWLAVIGPRKVGKTSLILEAARRAPSHAAVSILDVMAHLPLSLELFRVLALRAVDALVASALGGSLERRARDPRAYGELLRGSELYTTLPKELRADLDALVGEAPTPEAVGRWLDLPEELAKALGARVVVAIDEAQELARLASSAFDPFPSMRARWQRHERVAYVISGSAPTTLRELVTARHSPFFEHFDVLDLGPFDVAHAVRLLVDEAEPDRPIDEPLARRIVDVIGGHPFYLQLVGQALSAEPPPYDADALKPVLQSLLFSRTGRLALYFQNEYERLVGRATTAAATLEALALGGPMRLTDVSKRIGASTASTARYLERLADAIGRDGDLYAIDDPLFATWIRWRSPGGTVVPMSVVGDEAELVVARHLSALGFDLVYQSRGSRGAFDLLAIRGAVELGVQVKRSALPLRFTKTEWSRMDADAERWGWRFVIAAVAPSGELALLDPSRAKRAKEIRLADDAAIPNLLRWLDGATSTETSSNAPVKRGARTRSRRGSP